MSHEHRPSVQEAFDPELRAAQQEWDDYLDQRPYTDDAGRLRMPDGTFTSPTRLNKASDAHYENSMDEAWEDLSMSALADELAWAEIHEDATTAGDITDALLDKMTTFADEAEMDADAQTNLYNRILKLVDNKKEHYLSNPDNLELTDEQREERQASPEQTGTSIPEPGADSETGSAMAATGVSTGTSSELGAEEADSQQATATEHSAGEQDIDQGNTTSENIELRELYSALWDEDPALVEELARSLDEYTKLAAQRERRSVTARKYTREQVDQAWTRYEDARRVARDRVLNEMQASGHTQSELELIRVLDDTNEIYTANHIQGNEAERLGKSSRFVNWWARQEGSFFSVGTAKKAGVMMAIGAPVGLAAGLVAGPLVAGTAAAAAGGAAATRIARGFMSGTMQNRSRSATVAEREYDARLQKQLQAYEAGDTDYVANELQSGVEDNVRKNRKRLGKSVITAAVVGGAAGELADYLGGADSSPETVEFNGDDATPENDIPAPEADDVDPEADGEIEEDGAEEPQADFEEEDTEEVEPTEVTVEQGEGFTHILQRLAADSGKELSGAEAYRLYLDMVDSVGGENIIEGIDTYTESVGGEPEFRIASPGEAHWTPEAEAFVEQWLENLENET